MGQTDIRLLQETTTLAAQTTQVLKYVPRLSNTHPLAHERHYSTQQQGIVVRLSYAKIMHLHPRSQHFQHQSCGFRQLPRTDCEWYEASKLSLHFDSSRNQSEAIGNNKTRNTKQV